MRHGRYQRKLYLTFLAIASCFILLFGSLTSWLILSAQRSSYRALLQHTIAAKSDSTKVVLSTISSAVDALVSEDSAHNWAASDTDPEYYYYSSFLYQDIKRILANIMRIDYDLMVTRPDEDSFMITSTGTLSKQEFFQDQSSGITAGQWQELTARLEQDGGDFFFPVYRDGVLASLYYTRSVTYPGDGSLIVLASIPAATLFGSDPQQQFVVYDDDGVIAYSSEAEDVRRSLDESLEFIRSQPSGHLLEVYSQFSYRGSELFVLHPEKLDLTVVYQYGYNSLGLRALLPMLLALILYAVGALAAAFWLASRLYHPIHEVLENVPITPGDSKNLDEFQIIRQNTGTVSLLNEQLENAIREKDTLTTRRYYRELLFGIPDWNCPLTAEQMSAGYCVALVEFLPDEERAGGDDWYLQLQKNYLYIYVQELYPQHNVHCVSTDHDFCAIVLQTASRAQAQELVEQFFSIPSITCQLRIALSDMQEYVMHIRDCYQQALRLMEYRYLLSSTRLITSDKLYVPENTSYYYPLSMEARIIQTMASGQSKAIELFDSVVEENLHRRSLGPNPKKSLIFALTGTLMRAFEELKTTPEELLGHRIDFAALYARNGNPQILSTLREVMEQFVAAVQQRHQNSDDELLNRMLEYIYQNYADDIMLNDIAQHCSISPSYCSTLFKRLSCDNFKTFLNRYRIQQACEMLKSDPDMKITVLSQKVGFNSSSSFIRVFHRFVGTSPKAYADQLHKSRES